MSMSDLLLVLNAGSSSIKFTVFCVESAGLEAVEPIEIIHGQVEGIGNRPLFKARNEQGAVLADSCLNKELVGHHAALEYLLAWLDFHLPEGQVVAVGHRVVHGGSERSAPGIVDEELMQALETLIPLVPLHQPHNLEGIRVLSKERPNIPQIVCFDTAFHRHCAELTRHFGLPDELFQEGVKRYGFHGISYEYIADVMAAQTPELANKKVVILHLGNGCSMCAMENGKSVDTTMGFSALDGLLMGTRCGSLDPGVLLYLMREKNMDVTQLENLLYKESGLLGVSGVSNDMRELMASDKPQAKLAVDLFVYRIQRELGSLIATLGGIDALVFTAGIGENSAEIRRRVCHDAKWIGVQLDAGGYTEGGAVVDISSAESKVSVLVIPTNEELMIAKHVLAITHHQGVLNI